MVRVRSSLSDKRKRHEAIETLIDTRKISTQPYLRQILRERGILVTQPTLSRDLEELHIRKNSSSGCYELPYKSDSLKERLTKIIDESNAVFLKPPYGRCLLKVEPEYSQVFAITLEKFLVKRKLEVGIFVGPTGSVFLFYSKESLPSLKLALRELSLPQRTMIVEDDEDDDEEL